MDLGVALLTEVISIYQPRRGGLFVEIDRIQSIKLQRSGLFRSVTGRPTGLEEIGGCHHNKQNAPTEFDRIFGIAIIQPPNPL